MIVIEPLPLVTEMTGGEDDPLELHPPDPPPPELPAVMVKVPAVKLIV